MIVNSCWCWILACVAVCGLATAQPAGIRSNPPDLENSIDGEGIAGVTYAQPQRNRWQTAAAIKGAGSSVRDILITFPIPTEWPEQQVTIVKEDFPPEVQSIEYRELNCGVKQAVVNIPKLGGNQLVGMSVTLDVITHRIIAPSNTDHFRIPRDIPKNIRQFLGVSPQISFRNARLRDQVKTIVAEGESDWEKVLAIYDWVRESIKINSRETDDSITVFRDKAGSREAKVGLFVAMCRAAKVPARIVWGDRTEYAEFYLADETGNGHWFPANIAGQREFGSLSDPEIILQKGDSIKVPEKPSRQKYCVGFASATSKIEPVVQFKSQRILGE